MSDEPRKIRTPVYFVAERAAIYDIGDAVIAAVAADSYGFEICEALNAMHERKQAAARYKEALEHYADESHWKDAEGGRGNLFMFIAVGTTGNDIARAALDRKDDDPVARHTLEGE